MGQRVNALRVRKRRVVFMMNDGAGVHDHLGPVAITKWVFQGLGSLAFAIK